jgi:hypothetical protein
MEKQKTKTKKNLEVALPSALTIALGKAGNFSDFVECNGQCTRQRKI